MSVQCSAPRPLASRRPSHEQEERYTREKLIGAGTYGKVYRGKDLRENRLVALKEIKLDSDELGMPSTALREIALLRDLEHPNVIKLYDIMHTPTRLTLVFEYAEKDLKDYMTAHKPLLLREPFISKFIVWQLLHGLDYIHRRRILHRDLKPQNILINVGQTVVKLADFGLARVFGIPVRTYTHEGQCAQVVTLWYRAPEILLGVKVYSTPVDIWSIGCILAELITGGEPLFPGENEISQLYKIFQIMGTPTEQMWPGVSALPDFGPHFPKWAPQDLHKVLHHRLDPEGLDLLYRMLRYAPEERISAVDALAHPYFADLQDYRPGTRLPIT